MPGLLETLFGGDGVGGEPGLPMRAVYATPIAGEVAKTLTDFGKNPELFFGGSARGGLDLPALFSGDYRKQKAADLEAEREARKAIATAKGVQNVEQILGILSSAPTPESQDAIVRSLVGAGMQPEEVDPLNFAAQNSRDVSRRAASASGMLPEVANIANVDTAQQAGQTRFQSDRQLTEIGAQGAETRRNQANQFGYTVAAQNNAAALSAANEAADDARDLQNEKKGLKIKARFGRREDRKKNRPFADAMGDVLTYSQTPEGQRAFAANPAMQSVLGLAQATRGAAPVVGARVFEGAADAAQKGATAQGTPEQFGMTTSTKGNIDKDLIAAQDLGMQAERVIATYDPNWSTLSGKATLKGQALKDIVTGASPDNLANFNAWRQGAGELYSRNKLELTGQASNAQESREIQRVVPDPDALGPTQMQAALQSFRANAARKQAVLSKMKSEGRIELTTLERDYLNVKTLLDLKRAGLVNPIAFKNYFGMLTPERRADVLNLVKAEMSNAQP